MRRYINAFDLDGTLIDTKELNRQAYATVGVTIPDHAWGLPWHGWLPSLFNGDVNRAASIHRAKSSVYLRALISADISALELPALSVARGLHAITPEDVKIITASSITTAPRLIDRLGLVHVERHVGVTYETRLATLLEWSTYANVTYVDDNAETIARLKRDAAHIKLIHYTDQNVMTLRKEMNGL